MISKTIAIGGTRTWDDMILVFWSVRYIAIRNINAIIVSGGVDGGNVDATAENAADLHELAKMIFPAKWAYYKARGRQRSAGPIRNDDVSNVAEIGLFFWDGISPGTHGCMDLFDQKNKPYLCIKASGDRILAQAAIREFIDRHLPKLA